MGAVTIVHRLDFQRLQTRVAAEVAGDCELLRSDLAVRDDDHLLLSTVARPDGACRSYQCPVRGRCPLHPAGQRESSGEAFQSRFQSEFLGYCGRAAVLGRHGQWYDLRNWYAMEMGQDGWLWSDEETLRWLARDPLLGLLLRLSQRGAAVGWGRGGCGEGLLGWLSPQESAELVSALEPYPGPQSPPPPGLEACDPYLASDYLPELRRVVATLKQVAQEDDGLPLEGWTGLALTRE